MIRLRRAIKSTIALAVVLTFGLLTTTTAKAAGLSGSYTIDPTKAASSTNYTSFNDADSDLIYGSRANGATANGAGVSGAAAVASGVRRSESCRWQDRVSVRLGA